MIIKDADNKQPALMELHQLLEHPNATAATKKKIEQEIKNIQAGARGEAEVAYDLRAYLAENANWMVIHDLRLEIDGVAFQIDHLIGSRLMEFFVCESKHFAEGVAINEHGEFTAFYGKTPYGIPSPIAQNQRHIDLLRRLLGSGSVDLPKRLGFTLQPSLKSLILVSQRARITRPKAAIEGLDQVIKSDQMISRLRKTNEESGFASMASVAKVVGSDTLRGVFEQLARMHSPIKINWAGKFGLAPIQIAPINPRPGPAPAAPTAPARAGPLAAEAQPTPPDDKPKQKLVCAACVEPVPYNVAKFCWMNKAKFDGKVLCRECQQKLDKK